MSTPACAGGGGSASYRRSKIGEMDADLVQTAGEIRAEDIGLVDLCRELAPRSFAGVLEMGGQLRSQIPRAFRSVELAY